MAGRVRFGTKTSRYAHWVAAIGLPLACAACNETQPPFELSPSNAQIATALVQMLAAGTGCRGAFSLGAAQAWQNPYVLHTNSTSYELSVDADVSATRLSPASDGDIARCFGSLAEGPVAWAPGQTQLVTVRAALEFAGDSWVLYLAPQGAGPHLPLAAPHAFRLGRNARPGR